MCELKRERQPARHTERQRHGYHASVPTVRKRERERQERDKEIGKARGREVRDRLCV